MKDLGTLGGPHSSARAISDRGQIVGMSYITLSEYHAYLWTETGGMTDLGTLPGGTLSFALNINNLGQVVGWSTTASGQRHAVLWTT